MAARRRAGSFSPKTSRRLRVSRVDMLDMAWLLFASGVAWFFELRPILASGGRLCVGREVCVPFRSGGRGPVGHRRWFRQRPAVPEALHEVRVADEGSPEGDQVGVSLGNRLLCRLVTPGQFRTPASIA